jgi:hypothetical protein
MLVLEEDVLGTIPVVYDVIYACGSPQFPHRGQILLPLSFSEEEVEQTLTQIRQARCPGCLTDQHYQEAKALCACLGLKELRGTDGSVKLGEVVRARLVSALISSQEQTFSRSSLIPLLNHPRARQARLWVNYRQSCWEESAWEEWVAAFHDLTSSLSPLDQAGRREEVTYDRGERMAHMQMSVVHREF